MGLRVLLAPFGMEGESKICTAARHAPQQDTHQVKVFHVDQPCGGRGSGFTSGGGAAAAELASSRPNVSVVSAIIAVEKSGQPLAL